MSYYFRKGSPKNGTVSSRSTVVGDLAEIKVDNKGSVGWQENHDYYSRYPNRWARIRCVRIIFTTGYDADTLISSEMIRKPAAEAIGTMILILFGNGVDCQVVLSSASGVASSQKGSYLSISFIWGVGT
jgi:aquaglyceroporin related protein